ncbi:MAG: 23S ribosomal RNA methyltransferase Erm [Patescibacteria group bacterium]|nr:23S ribosomal RNA methyltransferase Erm [Patescibacteria group bacterium]
MRRIKHSQNFIKENGLVEFLIKEAGINRTDTVLEIGAGKGTITEQLCKKAGKVIAIEKDRKLYDRIDRRLKNYKNLKLVAGDFIDYPLPDQPYKCFSNIPFNYTADIVRKLLMGNNSPTDAYLFMQKESAQRFMGRMKSTQISLLLAPFWKTRVLYNFKRSDFKPNPSVDVVLVQFKRKLLPDINKIEYLIYRDFITYVFNQWKSNVGKSLEIVFTYKQLKRLSKSIGLDLRSKPTTVNYKKWLCLFRFICEKQNEVRVKAFSGYYEKYEELHSKRVSRYRI